MVTKRLLVGVRERVVSLQRELRLLAAMSPQMERYVEALEEKDIVPALADLDYGMSLAD